MLLTLADIINWLVTPPPENHPLLLESKTVSETRHARRRASVAKVRQGRTGPRRS